MSGMSLFRDLSWVRNSNWHVIGIEKVPNMADFQMATIKIPKLPEIHEWSYLGYTST